MVGILFPAFILSLILLGIHSWFGMEIIRRGIIFTDLAIGQMAALGAGFSLLFLDGRHLYPVSLAFALAGGLLIAYASKKISHPEAFIGLLYAAGLSGVFIVLSKSPHGMESFQNLMASDILFTPWEEMGKTALLYACLAGGIMVFNRKTTGLFRDILFFVTFAVTVTSSVRLAGVLVVFALLVAPACIAMRLSAGRKTLLLAWIIGTCVNVCALLVSYTCDLPTGYTLVFFHAAGAVTFAVIKNKDTGHARIEEVPFVRKD